MILVAEYVSSGHPDRLCDAIVNSIVNFVVSKDKDALCGLECAVHTNKVFIDGRIAAGKTEKVININDIKTIVKEVYVNAHYKNVYPNPDDLDIILNIYIETLSDDERDLRKYSDDQNVVTGYALNSPETNYLPVAHFVAIKLGELLNKNLKYYSYYGPDFKILVQIDYSEGTFKWKRLTISTQHRQNKLFKELYNDMKRHVDSYLHQLFQHTKLNLLSTIDEEHFYLNGAGDFIIGGPLGDNGLSGKKLCIDYYGPSIPIGGGAIYGKDPHKVDVCGAFAARQLALTLVKKYNYYSVLTTLAWSPGEKSPYIIEAYEIDPLGTKMKIDDALLPSKDNFSIEYINNDLNLEDRKITSILDIK